MRIFSALFIFIGAIAFYQANGQSNELKKISGDFHNISLTTFILRIEPSTDLHFYFDRTQTDSLKVDAVVDNKPVNEVLDSLFSGTDFHYLMKPGIVIITRGREIISELPAGFFGGKSGASFDVAVFDYMGEKNKETAEEEKIHEIGAKSKRIKEGSVVLSGYILDSSTGEALPGAVVYDEATRRGASADMLGRYSIALPSGRAKLKITSVGMSETSRQVMLYSNGTLNIELNEHITSLKEVVVEAERTANVTGTRMGFEQVDAKVLKQVPVVLGEADVMRVFLTMPGVQSTGEGSTGLNVRGGASSQNLVLLNDATIYNPAHFFGFFSAFNPDVIKNAELYKSGIPAEYGGRLSSVLEVNVREGNKKKLSGSGGISPVTSRLTLEGPIIRNKMSFLIGGRSTYSDWLLSQVPNKSIQKSKASFYDVNLLVSYDVDEKNSLSLSAYTSGDHFRLNSDTTYSYSNSNASLKWKHAFRKKLYGVFSGNFSSYNYAVSSEANHVNAYQLSYGINQSGVKADFNYFLDTRNTIYFGASAIYYSLSAGSYQPLGNNSLVVPDHIQPEQANENALYIADQFDITPKLSLYAGLRYSLYNFLGPSTKYVYADGVSKEASTITDTVSYKKGVINTYQGPEYRFSLRYLISPTLSVKAGFQRMRQYIQMISNTANISPTDIWKLSDPNIKPQVGDQISLGLYKNFKSNLIETSIEVYYKKIQDFLDYKSGAVLFLNHHIETDLINVQGRSYGAEFMIKKTRGKLNGWISYTYSRSLLQTAAKEGPESINGGQEYSSNYDKPNNLSVVADYKFSKRINVALNMTYSTGRPITLPLSSYDLNGSPKLYYSDRNEYRIPDYFRIDLALNLEGNHRIKKLAHSSWSLSIYNLTGRKNPYSVYFKSENGVVKGYQLSIFGTPIPTVTYNFKF